MARAQIPNPAGRIALVLLRGHVRAGELPSVVLDGLPDDGGGYAMNADEGRRNIRQAQASDELLPRILEAAEKYRAMIASIPEDSGTGIPIPDADLDVSQSAFVDGAEWMLTHLVHAGWTPLAQKGKQP
jgi:hypothetical protein